jgi:hypothetical protein
MVSESKWSIYFSKNTMVDTRVDVCIILNIMVEALLDKYLGLQLLVGADKSDVFQYLVDRVYQHTQSRIGRTLSMGGKDVKLKIVAQATPTYVMFVFLVPKQICKGISHAISHCWWGDDVINKKMRWFTCSKMCTPNKIGGMGFRDPFQ